MFKTLFAVLLFGSSAIFAAKSRLLLAAVDTLDLSLANNMLSDGDMQSLADFLKQVDSDGTAPTLIEKYTTDTTLNVAELKNDEKFKRIIQKPNFKQNLMEFMQTNPTLFQTIQNMIIY